MVRSQKRPASFAIQALVALLVAALARPSVSAAALAPAATLARVSTGAAPPRIAVVVVSQDLRASSLQGALEGAGEAALERAGRFTVMTAHDALNPAAAARQLERVEEAAAKMKAGKQALDDLDNVKATEAFSQAVDALKETDLSRHFPALVDAWTMKAAGHATGGETAPAKKDIEAVVALVPKAEFSPTWFPPDLLKFADAQRKLAANAKGELLVRTEPSGARVWVDGLYRGISPVTVAGLSAARHFVVASQGGYGLGLSTASPGEEALSLPAAELGPAWKKAVTDVQRDPEGPTRDAAAQALAKAAQLDQVLLVLAKKSLAGEQLDLVALRLEARDGHNAAFRTGTVNPSDPEQLAAFFDALTAVDARRDGKDPVHHFKGAGTNPVKTWVGLGLGGLAVVALGTGIALGVRAGDAAETYRRTPQTQAFASQQLVAEGKGLALGADISYLVALAAAGGSAVMLLTNRAPSGEEEPAPPPRPARKRSSDDEAADVSRDPEGGAPPARADKKSAEKAEEKRAQEERRRDEERREEERRRQEEAKAAEKRKAEEDEAAKRSAKKPTSKQREEEDRRKKEEAAKAEEEEARARAEAERRREEEERKRREKEEAERKKKPKVDDDDLRNY